MYSKYEGKGRAFGWVTSEGLNENTSEVAWGVQSRELCKYIWGGALQGERGHPGQSFGVQEYGGVCAVDERNDAIGTEDTCSKRPLICFQAT